MKNEKTTVRAFCRDLCGNGLEYFFDFEMDETPLCFITFLCNAARLHNRSAWTVIKYKWKMFWSIMTGKDFSLHSIILDVNEWQQFYAQMEEFNKRVKENS